MFTLWFTGLSTESKSLVINKVMEFLRAKGLTVIYLDANNCQDARWAAYVADLLNKQGVVVAASFVSYFGWWTSIKSIITKHIEVWVKNTGVLDMARVESCDIRVDLNINSVESCASLVASYLYLHEVIKLSENGIDPIVKIRKGEGYGMEDKLRAFLNKGVVDSGDSSIKSVDGKSFMTFEAIEDLMGMLEGEELRLLKAIKDRIFETIKAESYFKEDRE